MTHQYRAKKEGFPVGCYGTLRYISLEGRTPFIYASISSRSNSPLCHLFSDLMNPYDTLSIPSFEQAADHEISDPFPFIAPLPCPITLWDPILNPMDVEHLAWPLPGPGISCLSTNPDLLVNLRYLIVVLTPAPISTPLLTRYSVTSVSSAPNYMYYTQWAYLLNTELTIIVCWTNS